MKLVINAKPTAYSLNQISQTMTVGEILDYLQDYDSDTPVYLSFDSGYSYGNLTDYAIEERDDEE